MLFRSQAWQELQDAVGKQVDWFRPEIDKWLGKGCENGVLPETKQLYFSDLICQTHDEGVANRIKIDHKRGAVAENQLVIIENPFLTGKDYDFIGELHFFAMDKPQVDNIVRHVNAGLCWTSSHGALRTVGFGRVKNIDCSTKIHELHHPQSNDTVGIAIQPLYPFCISDRCVNNNLFESVAIIPGAVILGSIVTTWNHLCGKSSKGTTEISDPPRPKLKEHFSLLRISHAVPSEKIDTRPITLPLSLVKVLNDDTLYDVILLESPCLINGETPAFAIDWKTDANTDYGLPKITKELRTRTRIDPETLRAEDEKLFSYEQVVPKGLLWNAQVDLSRIPEKDRKELMTELQSLLSQGLGSLGKTKTPATVAWLPSIKATLESDTKALSNKQWIITLQTDTLLGVPVRIDESSGELRDMDESSSQVELRAMYEKTWSDLSGGKLQLVRYFAKQRLSGGYYRHNRFREKKIYKPWLLTEAGSVFLLRATDEAADETLIEEWLAQGLPVQSNVLEYYDIGKDVQTHWQHCPFIPQNGYGEIAVNLAIGTRLTPDSKNITSIKDCHHDDK